MTCENLPIGQEALAKKFRIPKIFLAALDVALATRGNHLQAPNWKLCSQMGMLGDHHGTLGCVLVI